MGMRFDTFLKLLTAEVLGIAGFLWGGLDGLLRALLVFMVVDYVTGIAAAFREKKLNSETGFSGILRKGVMLLLVAMGNVLDTQVLGGGSSTFRSAVIGFYLANEGLSILENAGRLGVKWPKVLAKALEQLRHEDDGCDENVDKMSSENGGESIHEKAD